MNTLHNVSATLYLVSLRSKDTQSRQDKNAKKGNMSRSKTVVNQESKRTTKAKIDVDLSANGIYKVYRSPMTCISTILRT